MIERGRLVLGDCLDAVRDMPADSVDLIYLDPPFNSGRDYTSKSRGADGGWKHDGVVAFTDRWAMSQSASEALDRLSAAMTAAGLAPAVADAWRHWAGVIAVTQPAMASYLGFMAERLLALRTVLKPTGSLYLHCDPSASHYLKVVLDMMFGHGNFRNELVWKRTSAANNARRWGPIHDVILFYSKSPSYTWNRTLQPYAEGYVDATYKWADERGRYRWSDITGQGFTKGESGRPWRGYDPSAVGKGWAIPRQALDILRAEGVEIPDGYQDRLELLYSKGFIRFPKKGRNGGTGKPKIKKYLDDGFPVQGLITDIPCIKSSSKDRTGYPTQKPLALLQRIVSASTNRGEVVLDPFCGSGTTLEAAESLGRDWIGIDVSPQAIQVSAARLEQLANRPQPELDLAAPA